MKKIIFIILILVLSTSFCYAWTYDDFITFTQNNYIYQTNSSYQTAMTKTIENLTTNNEKLTTMGIDVDDYTSFYGAYDNGSGYTYYYFLNNTENSVCSYSSSQFQISNVDGVRVRTNNYIIDTSSKTTFTSLGLSKTKGWGLGYSQSSFVYQDSPIIENYLNYCEILPRENLSTNNLPWYIADGRIGVKNRYNNLRFYLHDINSNFYKELLANNVGTYNSGSQYQLYIQNTSGLINNNEYYISIQSSGDSTSLLDSNTFVLSWLDNSSPTSSGDNSSSIDINETNNLIKDLPKNIGNTFYNSGDSGEKGIIQKVYDDLFTISDEEIDNKLQKFIDDNNFDSGEVAIATLGFDYLKNSGDFIISWGNINTPYFKLSGDSINFSAFVRSNDTLEEVMSYVHIILGLSLFLLLGHNMFKTLLATLGISSEIYASNKDDSKPIESVVVTTDSKGNKTQTRSIKNGNITQRWVRKL